MKAKKHLDLFFLFLIVLIGNSEVIRGKVTIYKIGYETKQH